ncbi:MAG: hypothetical protein U9N63_02570 [Pseudomonadota bacterium]|nr:hypothetical protein [Pseudomonadota bacterium]
MRNFFLTVCIVSWVCLFRAGPVLSEVVSVAESSPSLDFIYVNANIGEAAGGHTALRLGETVFHYQFQQNGNFLLVRESWSRFRFVYNELCNRSIFISSLPLAPPIYEKLRYHFIAILLAQEQTLRRLEESETQLKFIENLRAGQKTLALPGLGLFDRSGSKDPHAVSLRHEVEEALGNNFLAQEKEQAGLKIALFAVSFDSEAAVNGFSEQLTLQETLHILSAGSPLAQTALILPLENEAVLTLAERESLQHFKSRLRISIIGLLRSNRPDRGAALLLQMARYQTVQRSLAANRLLSLDPFSDRALSKPVTEADISSGMLQQVQSQLLNEVAAQRHIFFNEIDHPEVAYSFLETSRGRLSELEKVVQGAGTLRVETGPMSPSRNAAVALTGFDFVLEQLQATAATLKGLVAAQQERIKKEYHYNLVTYNCATELMHSLNTTFADPAAERRALGACLEPEPGLSFAPFIFYDRARTTFKLDRQEILPSRRLRKLHSLYEDENSLKVWFREANTLSSTIYEPRTADTPFLFFTDDARLLRPLEGATNLCYAALHGLSGILSLPFDGGERVHQGVQGIFYSLPELFFWNIRKGTYGPAAVSSSRAAP